MSKYRICVTQNKFRRLFGEVCVAVCLFSALCSLPQYWWSWPSFSTLFALIGVATALLIFWRLYKAFSNQVSVAQYVLSLTSDGIIRIVGDSAVLSNSPVTSTGHLIDDVQTHGTSMKIHHSSQLFTWGLCITVMRQKRKWFEKDYNHFVWILKGECSEADYRRLARAIILARKATPYRN
ncbi:hypothetical protein [Alteromonas sp. S015]|uniref:hypothetical protein n=1 Tax=Alteromonas sp. S015 TaxID=3117401 RepID=UPI002FE0BDA3